MNEPMAYEKKGTLWYVDEAGKGLYGIFRLTVGGHVRACFTCVFATREAAQKRLDEFAEQRDMVRKPTFAEGVPNE